MSQLVNRQIVSFQLLSHFFYGSSVFLKTKILSALFTSQNINMDYVNLYMIIYQYVIIIWS